MYKSNQNELAKLEHDDTYHVKKVSVYGDDGTGSLTRVFANGIQIGKYDYISVAYPNTTTETYTFKTGGSGGTTVATVSIVYTDDTKNYISTVTKS